MLSGLEVAELPADAIEVGRIADAWGIKGWFKVLPYSANPEALFSARQWYLLPTEKGTKPFSGTVLMAVKESKVHSDSVVACASGIDDRNGAEALKGSRIFISRATFPKAAADEFYWVDLIGLQVVNREGQSLGVVRELMSTGPQTVLVIEAMQDDKPVERMIPFVSAYVDDVSLTDKTIRVDWQLDY
ncbi:ribosome maturation factor RimM [Rhodoferax mekongensis]|uniref:ribosome maturation factor RimM n=1 Tax=Rhodoferax mekongensis TaxID=3068341 RepID=UPI0028BDFB6E|nr:ribosome maturation factor RimM [Rhodoferax sp. TBRC 17199]MDT7516112.1 ribosome maturation factor RimM [Rhodoferax sp. TBRC 17199]